MSVFYFPKLSTDGLISYIDTLNPKCYVSGSSDMYDLVDGESYSVGSVGYESSSLKFNGVDQQIQYKDLSVYGSDLTVEVYYKALDGASTVGVIGQGGMFRIFTDVSGDLKVFYRNNSTGQSLTVIAQTDGWDDNIGLWTYASFQLESASFARAYINDVYTTNDSITFGFNGANQATSFLGNTFSGASYWFEGYLAVVRVYNRALSLEEIQSNKLALGSRFRYYNL